ncbi:unnamed protein product [Schistosoma mattheei]|uniref:Uncharacterized protein n=1 Tax=Schistosoma mattheei TaxID=31246 RepID=A0A183NHH0_9TREM|nr:unnamed protein product [Schistosoma mattheei]
MQLDNLNFTDHLALLSNTYQQIPVKTKSVPATSESVDLNIHKNDPPQLGKQRHVNGASLHVPCLHPGYFIHSSQSGPCQPVEQLIKKDNV